MALYQQKVNKNEMLKQFGVSANEICQQDFFKIAILNCSMKGAKISSFYRAPCSKSYTSQK